MATNTLNFQIQLPDDVEAAAKLLALQQEFVAAVTNAGGKTSFRELPPRLEDMVIKRWIVDDCDTNAVDGVDLLMSLGNVIDDVDNIFGNVIFEDGDGVLNKVITTFEILRITDPIERADLLRRFAQAESQNDLYPRSSKRTDECRPLEQ